MRITFLLFISLFLGQILKSQEYLPFANSNSIWLNAYYGYDLEGMGEGPPDIIYESYIKYCAPGIDTIINTLSYKQIYFCGGEYKGAIRDEAGIVFYVPNDSINEFVLYDFTVQIQDVVQNIYFERQEYFNYEGQNESASLFSDLVLYVDSVLINGQNRKRIYFFSGNSWTEGIGSSWGLFEGHILIEWYSTHMYCMSENDTTLYPQYQTQACEINVGIDDVERENQIITVYPNPSKNRFTIEVKDNAQVETLSLLNTIGQEFEIKPKLESNAIVIDLNSFPNGIYFLLLEIEGQVYTKKLVKNSSLE